MQRYASGKIKIILSSPYKNTALPHLHLLGAFGLFYNLYLT